MEQANASAGEDAPDPALSATMTWRKQRIGLSFVAYLASSGVVAFAGFQQWLPWFVVAMFVASGVLIHTAFLLLALLDQEVSRRDALMAMALIVVGMIPSMIVMALLDSRPLQAALLVLVIVPALQEIWLLNMQHAQQRLRNDALQAELDDALSLVNRDALTGLFNRQQLFEILSREAARQTRAKGVFSVALLDIDQFRQINQQHGYETGDAVLRAIATAFGSRLRAMDVLGRYGEEAFMLIMPNTPLEGALIKAARMHEQIAQLAVKGKDASAIKVSASIGVTAFCQGEPFEVTLARAESAVQVARAEGPNRIGSLPLVGEPVVQEDATVKSALASPRT
ncbi:MAG: GGDEF domain-containing protein [Burkholderiales bacterium]|nr:GGDEF domain-containing protein [Burkholderiales bacterium]